MDKSLSGWNKKCQAVYGINTQGSRTVATVILLFKSMSYRTSETFSDPQYNNMTRYSDAQNTWHQFVNFKFIRTNYPVPVYDIDYCTEEVYDNRLMLTGE